MKFSTLFFCLFIHYTKTEELFCEQCVAGCYNLIGVNDRQPATCKDIENMTHQEKYEGIPDETLSKIGQCIGRRSCLTLPHSLSGLIRRVLTEPNAYMTRQSAAFKCLLIHPACKKESVENPVDDAEVAQDGTYDSNSILKSNHIDESPQVNNILNAMTKVIECIKTNFN